MSSTTCPAWRFVNSARLATISIKSAFVNSDPRDGTKAPSGPSAIETILLFEQFLQGVQREGIAGGTEARNDTSTGPRRDARATKLLATGHI